jgi:hypothetical protein
MVLETEQPVEVEPGQGGIWIKIPAELNRDDLPVIRLDLYNDSAPVSREAR